jgi:hypothetical protein
MAKARPGSISQTGRRRKRESNRAARPPPSAQIPAVRAAALSYLHYRLGLEFGGAQGARHNFPLVRRHGRF